MGKDNAMGARTWFAISTITLCSSLFTITTALADSLKEKEERLAKEEQIAAELANPLAPITTFAMQYRSEFGNGPDDDLNQQLRLQPSFFKPFQDTSAFLLRTALPVRFNSFPQENAGLGDLSLSPYYVPDITTSTFLGVGGAFTFPSATDNLLGSERWSAGPAFVLAQIGEPVVYGTLMQHVWSYAGASSRSDVNVLTVQPFATYLLGGGFSATVNCETSYDFAGAASSRWVIPIAVAVSKVVEVGKKYFNIGLGYVTYADRPTQAADAELRLNLTYVIQ